MRLPAPKPTLQLPRTALRLPPPSPRPHPARFPALILDRLRELVPKGRVLDPFGGVGTLGRLGPEWDVTTMDIEWEWAIQIPDNGAHALVGDALALPFADASWLCICTSPPYANRLSDQYVPKTDKPSDGTRRSYRLALGRKMHPHNQGAKQWGQGYRDIAEGALVEFARVLADDGLLVLNIKNHVRAGEVVPVTEFWVRAAMAAGFEPVRAVNVPIKGDQNTARMRAQGKRTVDHETIQVMRRTPRPKKTRLRIPR